MPGSQTATWATWTDLIRWKGETGEGNLYQCITPIVSSSSSSSTTDVSVTQGGEPVEEPTIETDDLQRWLDAINQWIEDEEKWIDDTIIYSEQEGSRGDLPAPIPPRLPDLTDFLSLPALISQFGPWGLVVWVGIKVGKRVLEGWIEKKMNPGVGELKQMLQDIRDALKKGLLYNDGADSTLLKAFLDTEFKSYLRGLPDLAYVDEIIDFGAFRCHIKGKMIEY